MLNVTGLKKQYGSYMAVNDISFSVNTGEVVALLGLNGAGKTTTMNMITGYSAPTDGQVTLFGESAQDSGLLMRKNVGYLPETPPLYQDLTPSEHLEFVCRARGIPDSEIKAEVKRVCELVSITHMAGKLIRNLSKGYRQRVGFAAALVGDPKLIILDEPTVGLDPMQLIEIRKLIISLAPEHMIIISSHILSEVFSVCTRIVVLNKGVLCADLSKEEFLASILESSKITVQMPPKSPDITEILSSTQNVESCQPKPAGPLGLCEYELTMKNKDEHSTEIFELLSKNNLSAVSIYHSHKSLEDAFMEIAGGSTK